MSHKLFANNQYKIKPGIRSAPPRQQFEALADWEGRSPLWWCGIMWVWETETKKRWEARWWRRSEEDEVLVVVV